MRVSAVDDYLWIWGAALVVLGAGSLILHPDFAVGDAVTEERLFGVFETNGWHGLAGLAAGLAALVSVWRGVMKTEAVLLVAVAGGILPAIGFFISGDDSAAFGLVPVDIPDAVSLHLVPGLVGLAALAFDAKRRSAHASSSLSGR